MNSPFAFRSQQGGRRGAWELAFRRRLVPAALLVAFLGACEVIRAADKPPAALQKSVTRGIQFLAKVQDSEGAYSKAVGPGPTALITTAILRHGRSPRDPVVAKSLKYLERFVQADGSIHADKSRLPTYETCLSMVCFQEANSDGKYDDLLKNAERFMTGLQKDGDQGKDISDPSYGGIGYGREGRPDLSNTHFLVEALRAVGESADSEAVQKALLFVSRCQNLESEHNTTPSAALVNDGGFYYTPAGEGASPAGKTANGGLRSYGAMTYAGLKSMIFAGVERDDPRVKAAVEWIGAHYTLKENPGMDQAGLYYYYHLFAKALHSLDEDQVVDQDGQKHDWRKDLLQELASRQQKDGSWVNADGRFLEDDPQLCTGFALLALSYCREK